MTTGKRGRPTKWDGVLGEGRLIATWLAIEVRRRSKLGGRGTVRWACMVLARENGGLGVVEDRPGFWRGEDWRATGPTRRALYQEWEGIRELHKRAEKLLNEARPGVRENWENQANALAEQRRRKLG